ncbi:class I SAM-dependent methyltransferase [Euzebya tangerina]|uniref:class I SAM-dependent methyltransferase n=1 Tax=Euzebya tangerina TaxID=591198 RepID=UPI000E316118|nr:class I SAM-dependent methyltransferase [Euzebya tangerina]
MSTNTRNDDLRSALVVGVIVAALTGIGTAISVPVGIATGLGAATTAIIMVALEVYRRLRSHAVEAMAAQLNASKQTEALGALYALLSPRAPLLPLGGWAASADLLTVLVDQVKRREPTLVVEASSGTSTVAIGYALQQRGHGRVVSLESSPEWAEETRRQVRAHGLEDVASVIDAPLRAYEIDGETWRWYDLEQVELDHPIDLLVIDGPPGTIQPLARFPAVPLLWDHLSSSVTIVADDGARPDEAEMVTRWTQVHPELSSTYLELEKGAFVLHRAPGDVSVDGRTPA